MALLVNKYTLLLSLVYKYDDEDLKMEPCLMLYWPLTRLLTICLQRSHMFNSDKPIV